MTRPGPQAVQAAKAAVIALAGAACVFAAPAAQADPTAPQSAAECRAITDFAQRGACWDALDSAGLHDQVVVKKKGFGLGARPPVEAAIVVPKPKKEKVVNPDAGEVNSLTITIASIEDTPMGRMLLTSTDGAVWEQTDSDPLNNPPRVGDTVEVSKSMFSGYMCHMSHWQAVRCQRDK
jgi:hypothetical protein